ncbi:hypothetical protein D3P08_07910 [Paenibacillus nanensis]|uniref:Uncharacterized protein n=1 Tax=Paenibacillus nanensis TaxID=393251 RepID=A0A3A1V0C8_9BACL|nr:spore germination protein GerPC [Paenibacillus nanensis]RIX54157.1 hypothetical protein D3P08_07910 [Paenibacillus nanensis]
MKDEHQLSPWQAWSYEVQLKLKAHEELIEKLECTVKELCEQVKKLEAKPTYTIESLQYNFDQLKVEKLEGTLNIGMSAPDLGGTEEGEAQNGGDSVGQLSVGQGNVFPAASPGITPPGVPYQDVLGRLNRFLDNDAHHYLLACEQAMELSLDPHHRRIIIEDIRKQMPTRIQYYLTLHQKEAGAGMPFPDLIADRVFTKTKRDAETAMNAYITRLKSNGSSQNGG